MLRSIITEAIERDQHIKIFANWSVWALMPGICGLPSTFDGDYTDLIVDNLENLKELVSFPTINNKYYVV